MSRYVDADYVKLVSSIPAADVDLLEAHSPGIVNAISEAVSRLFDSKLAKRYAAPFSSPYPEALRWQVAQVVAYQLFLRRGFNPSSAQDGLIEKNRDEALAWLKEAADSKEGLVELPLRENTTAEGVSRGGPLCYSEASPYAWTDVQRDTGRAEDER